MLCCMLYRDNWNRYCTRAYVVMLDLSPELYFLLATSLCFEHYYISKVLLYMIPCVTRTNLLESVISAAYYYIRGQSQ